MKETYLYLVCVVYFFLLLFLSVQLYRIHQNPDLFDIIPGYENYRSSKYFWPINKEYGKRDSPDNGFAITIIPVFIASYLWVTAVDKFHSIGSSVQGYTFHLLGQNGSLYIALSWVLFAFVLSFYSALFSRLPKDIQFTLFHMGRGERRSVVWKRWTIWAIVVVAIQCPGHICSMAYGGYVNEMELVYTDGFDLEPHAFVFSDIVTCEIVKDDATEQVIHYYLENEVGNRIDLCDSKFSFETYKEDVMLWEYVDQYIRQDDKAMATTLS